MFASSSSMFVDWCQSALKPIGFDTSLPLLEEISLKFAKVVSTPPTSISFPFLPQIGCSGLLLESALRVLRYEFIQKPLPVDSAFHSLSYFVKAYAFVRRKIVTLLAKEHQCEDGSSSFFFAHGSCLMIGRLPVRI